MAQLNVVFQTSETDGFGPDDIFGGAFNLGGLIHEGTFNVTDGTTETTGSEVADWDISAAVANTRMPQPHAPIPSSCCRKTSPARL